jgi:enterochelin esterase family protein
MIPTFAKALVEEVLPQVEKAYHVTRDRNQRAIAGLSMGGAETVYTGLHHLDKFAWMASFSGAFVMWPRANPAPPPAPNAAAAGGGRGGRGGVPLQTEDFAKNFPSLDAKANSQIRMLWIACGTEDGLLGSNRQFKEWLKSKNIQFTEAEIPNYAHVWPLWRQNLAEVAQQFFQPKTK